MVQEIDMNKKKYDLKISNLAKMCIKNDDVFHISSKECNVVLMSENHYKNLIESLHLYKIKGVYNDIDSATKTPTEDFIKKAPFSNVL